jgi:hypothetical protein
VVDVPCRLPISGSLLDHGNPEIKRAVTLLASLNERPLKRSPNGPHLE